MYHRSCQKILHQFLVLLHVSNDGTSYIFVHFPLQTQLKVLPVAPNYNLKKTDRSPNIMGLQKYACMVIVTTTGMIQSITSQY